MNHIASLKRARLLACGAAIAAACAASPPALGQAEGGLYIAGDGFSFEQAAEQGLARNPKGQRFFVLVLPPNGAALTKAASRSAAAVRERVSAAGGVFYVCQRDIDSGAIDASKLLPGVVAVRGFPPSGSDEMPRGERAFPAENAAALPSNNTTLTRLRSACS
jgi:intracellular sulfur oxidation DsrE/DsrF family protein